MSSNNNGYWDVTGDYRQFASPDRFTVELNRDEEKPMEFKLRQKVIQIKAGAARDVRDLRRGKNFFNIPGKINDAQRDYEGRPKFRVKYPDGRQAWFRLKELIKYVMEIDDDGNII